MTGRVRGFTLVELMVVLVIAGILAAIAVPMYTGYVRRAHRAEAQSALLELARALEAYRSRTLSYADSAQSGPPGPPKNEVFGFSKAPRDSSTTTWYELQITAADKSSFEIRATAGNPWRPDCRPKTRHGITECIPVELMGPHGSHRRPHPGWPGPGPAA